VLGALDDKIELNRRMNATLEAMARALFLSWFVDFDPVRAKLDGRQPVGMDAATASLFPEHFDHDETMLRPRGWLPKSVYDCATFINGVAFKNVQFSADGSGLPVVKIAELKDGISKQTKFTNDELAPKYKIRDGEILFSWSGSPDTSIDTFLWSGGDGWLNQHIFKVEFHQPEEKLFVY
jgi:type I restriction enzyme S subunit